MDFYENLCAYTIKKKKENSKILKMGKPTLHLSNKILRKPRGNFKRRILCFLTTPNDPISTQYTRKQSASTALGPSS